MKTKLILFLALSINTAFAQRTVLVELFSNSSCPPCATNTPQVTNYVMNNPSNTIAIVYHTNFPYTNDSMYHDNPVDVNARVAYYGISYSPSAVFEGNQYNSSTPNFLPNMSTTISTRAQVAPQYSITPVYASLDNNMLNVSFAFQSLVNNTGQTLKAHIAVVEETVLKSSFAASPGSNSETQYHYVMRKMMPDANGSALQNTALNGKDTITLSWNLSRIKSEDELRVVAFVQNETTKEIYQAAFTTPQVVTSVYNNALPENELTVYPNPAAGNFIVGHPGISETDLLLFDLNGKKIKPQLKRLSIDKLQVSLENNAKGIYFIQLQTASGVQTQKIVLQ